jgi:hypothetical protein
MGKSGDPLRRISGFWPSEPLRFRALRFQIKPFEPKSGCLGACLDIVNRSIQFCRDKFRAGVCFRHSSKEVIRLWGQPGVALFNHDTPTGNHPSATGHSPRRISLCRLQRQADLRRTNKKTAPRRSLYFANSI